MPYVDLSHLPRLIRERLNREELIDSNLLIQNSFNLTTEQLHIVLGIENDVLLKKHSVNEVPNLVRERLGMDDVPARALAVDLWGRYFLLFQDFLEPVAELITQNGGNIGAYELVARKFLHPTVQLHGFFQEFFADTPMQNANEQQKTGCMEAVLDYAHGILLQQEFEEKIAECFKAGGSGNQEALAFFINTTNSFLQNGTLSKQWAEYYVNLADNVLCGRKGYFEDEQEEVHGKNASLMYILQAFEKLPDSVKNHFTSTAFRSAQKELEERFGVSVENIILRATIKDFPLSELGLVIRKEFNVSPEIAGRIKDEIMRLFTAVMWHYNAEKQEVRIKNQESSGTMGRTFDTKKQRAEQETIQNALVQFSHLAIDYASVAQGIIKQSGIGIADSALTERLARLLVTRIRSIRNAIETREKLLASLAVGGIGLNASDTERVLKEANRISDLIAAGKYFETEKSLPESEIKKVPILAIENVGGLPTFVEKQAVKDEPKSTNQEVKLEAQSTEHEVNRDTAVSFAPQTPAVFGKPHDDERQPPQKPDVQSGAFPKIPPAPPSPAPPSPAPPLAPPPMPLDAQPLKVTLKASTVQSAKTPFTDIKQSPRLVDTIEELRIMTLKDFRRLSSDPQAATQKIYQKIQMLEKESYTKKMAGIKAWKENEISSLYVAMGQESFGKGLPLAKIIEQRASAGQQSLTEAEFDVLLDLNELLRA